MGLQQAELGFYITLHLYQYILFHYLFEKFINVLL